MFLGVAAPRQSRLQRIQPIGGIITEHHRALRWQRLRRQQSKVGQAGRIAVPNRGQVFYHQPHRRAQKRQPDQDHEAPIEEGAEQGRALPGFNHRRAKNQPAGNSR